MKTILQVSASTLALVAGFGQRQPNAACRKTPGPVLAGQTDDDKAIAALAELVSR